MDGQTLRTILLDQLAEFESLPASFIERALSVEFIPRKGTVITGVRRSGKSTYLQQFSLGRKSLKRPLYVKFSDERFGQINRQDLNKILLIYYEIHNIQDGEKFDAYFDEIQLVDGWHLFINRLIEGGKAQVFLTGSSSRLLSKEIATELRGRNINYELFPLSLREILKYEGINIHKLTSNKRAQAQKIVILVLTWGGFPEVYPLKSDQMKRRVLAEYLDVLLLRDIIERNGFSNGAIVRHLFDFIINQYGAMTSISKLTQILKSMGHKIDRSLVANFFVWLEDCYAVFMVPIYSRSVQKQRVNPKKTYIIDSGLAELVSSLQGFNYSRRLENLVFLELRQHFGRNTIYYYKTAMNNEIDFYLPAEKMLINVCASLADKETREREERGLVCAMEELNISESILVTLDHSEEIRHGKLKIYCLSVIDFVVTKIK